jgi:hypothetical protein
LSDHGTGLVFSETDHEVLIKRLVIGAANIQILVNESALKVAGLDSLNLGNQIWREKIIA